MTVEIPVADLRLHPATELIPEMRPNEWKAFLEDVRANGVQEPVVVQEGNVILDGRHRHRAAGETGSAVVPCRVVNWTEEEQEAYVYRTAVLRRHLSDDQRAVLAARWGETQSAKARKERAAKAGKAGGRGRTKKADSLVSTVSTKLSEDPPEEPKKRTHEQAAELFTLPKHKVRQAIALDQEAPDLAAKVLDGSLRLNDAKRQSKRRANQSLVEKFTAERQAALENGTLSIWELNIEANRVSANLESLEAEMWARPEFAERQNNLRQLNERVKWLEQEWERLSGQRDSEQFRLIREVREAIQEKHGRIVRSASQTVRIKDADTQDSIVNFQAMGDDREVRELLLREAGRCIYCEAELDTRDDVPDKPGFRHIVCSWCIPHRGKTHCAICGSKLGPDDWWWCSEECKAKDPDEDEDEDCSAEFAEFFKTTYPDGFQFCSSEPGKLDEMFQIWAEWKLAHGLTTD